MIVVTGATGTLGSQVVDLLLERVPAEEVGVSVRDVEKAEPLRRRGVLVRRGDFTEPSSLREALDGAATVLVVSAAITGPAAVRANADALDAAVAAGAQRVLYTSHQAASPHSHFTPQRTHAATEQHLAGLGVPFTALRHGFYASTLRLLLRGALTTGVVEAPADGPVSWTAHDDLARAAVAALLEPGGALDGVTAPLTAGEALDLEAVVERLGAASGRPVRRVVVDDEEWRRAAVARGVPEPGAEMLLGMFRAARAGEFAVVDPTLGEVLGRTPATVDPLLASLVAA